MYNIYNIHILYACICLHVYIYINIILILIIACTIFLIFRGDLAITLLVHYKDDPVKLARIMDKLLDRDVHQLIKSPILSSYYTANPPTKSEVRI